MALRVDVLRIVVPGLGLFAIVAVARTKNWPDWSILFDTIVLEFVFGAMLGKVTLLGFRLPQALAGVLIIAGFTAILVVPLGPEHSRVLTWGLPAFAIVAGAVSLEPFIANALPRWLLALGDASYSIYLSHGFVLPVLGLMVAATGWSGIFSEGFTIVLCLVVSSIAGCIVFMLIENPMLCVLKGRK